MTKETNIVDLCYLSETFPELPPEGCIIPRDMTISHLEERLNNNNVVFVNGVEGVGVTTTLALFAIKHHYNCINYFNNGFVRLLLEPSTIEKSLVRQLYFYVTNETPSEEICRTEQLSSLYLRVSQKIKSTKETLYFVFDGFGELPIEIKENLSNLFAQLPWDRAKFLFSGKMENFGMLISDNLRRDQANELYRFTLQESESYFKVIKSNLTQEENKAIYSITDGFGYKMDYVRLKYAEVNNFEILFNEEDEISKNLYFIEIQRLIKINDQRVFTLLALIAYSELNLTSDLVMEILCIKKFDIDVLFAKSKDFIIIKDNYLRYKSANFHKYMRTYFKPLKQKVELLMLDALERHAGEYTNYQLSLYKSYHRNQSIVRCLTPSNVQNCLEKEKSQAALNMQCEYGYSAACSEETMVGDAFRFAVNKSTSQEIERVRLWDCEIKALIAIGQYEQAFAISQDLYLKEERLKSFAMIARAGDKLSANMKDTVLASIRHLVDDIKFELIPDKAFELAKLLIPIDFTMALSIIDKVGKESRNSFNVDKLYTMISLSVNEETLSEKGDAINKYDLVKSKIQDDGLRNMADAMKSIFKDLEIDEVINNIKQISTSSQKIFFLQYWIPEHRKKIGIEKVVKLAVNLVVGESNIDIPKASVLCEYATALPYIPEEDLNDLLLSFDSLADVIKTPTKDYVILQLFIIEALSKFDENKACNRLINLYFYVTALPNKSISILSESLILSRLDKLGDKKIIEKDFMAGFELLNEIKDKIHEEFSQTAFHLKVVEEPIKALVCSYKSFIKDVIPQMNTAERRCRAYALAAVEYIRQISIKNVDWDFFEYLLNHIDYRKNDRSDALLVMVKKLRISNHYTLELFKSIKKLTPYFYEVDNDSEKCYLLSHLYLWLYKHVANDSYTQMIYESLVSSWESINLPSMKIDIGFCISELLAKVSKEKSKDFLDKTVELKGSNIFTSSSNLSTFIDSLDLYTRSVGLLIRAGICSQDDLDLFSEVASNLNSLGEEFMAWSKISLEYYKVEDEVSFKKICNEYIVLRMDNYVMTPGYEKIIYYSIAPTLFLFSPTMFFEKIQTFEEFIRNACIDHACNFIFLKYPSTDSVRTLNSEFKLSFTDYSNLLDLIEKSTDESVIFTTIENICRSLKAKKGPLLSLSQMDMIVNKLKNIANTQLPTCSGIQHNGYKVACHAAIFSLENRSQSQSAWNEIEQEIESIANMTDRSFLYFFAANFIDRNNVKQRFMNKGFEIANSLSSVYDRFTRFDMCLNVCFDTLKSQFAPYYKRIIESLKSERDSDLSFSESLIDLAYQYDDSLADSLIEIYDKDPARIQYKRMLVQHAESTKKLAEARKQISSVKQLDSEECKMFFSKEVDKIINGKFECIQEISETGAVLNPIYKFPISQSKDAIIYFMENAFNKHLVSRKLTGLLRDIHKALLFNLKLVLSLSSGTQEKLDKINRSIRENYQVTDTINEKSLYEIVIFELCSWYSKDNTAKLRIIDDSFQVSDLTHLSKLFDINKELSISILTHRKNVKLMSEFQDAWKRDFTKMSGMIEITAICYADNTDHGPKLINSWTAIDRSRRIKKGIILEKSTTDNEQYVMTDTTTIDKENIEEEWSMYHDDQYKIIEGKTIIYDSIIIQ